MLLYYLLNYLLNLPKTKIALDGVTNYPIGSSSAQTKLKQPPAVFCKKKGF